MDGLLQWTRNEKMKLEHAKWTGNEIHLYNYKFSLIEKFKFLKIF